MIRLRVVNPRRHEGSDFPVIAYDSLVAWAFCRERHVAEWRGMVTLMCESVHLVLCGCHTLNDYYVMLCCMPKVT